MEHILQIKITVHIDTDKAIYRKEFDNIKDASEYLDSILKMINSQKPRKEL